MLVADVQASIRFYQSLGFHVAATEMDADGCPLWALLRRDDADLFIEDRSRWPQHLIPLPNQPVPMALMLGDETASAQTDPDGVTVRDDRRGYRRAA